jgi:uncharacterized protein YndB with AHSA1/START domain
MTNTLNVEIRGDREVVLRRQFDAPRHLVFEAFTKPDHLKRWMLGPPGWAMVSCKAPDKVGEKYRYEWVHTDGMKLVIGGVVRELVPPERIVVTELMDAQTEHSLITTTFTEKDGKTLMTTVALYPSKEFRGTMIKSGMEQGVAASYDRLETLLEVLLAEKK